MTQARTTEGGIRQLDITPRDPETQIRNSLLDVGGLIAGQAALNVAGTGDYIVGSVSADDVRKLKLVCTGALTGHRPLVMPLTECSARVLVYNLTTGAFNLSVKLASQTLYISTVAQGKARWFFHDGVNWMAEGAEFDPLTGGRHKGRVYSTSNQSIANATEVAIAFNAEYDDAGGWHDNATNNTRATCRAADTYVFRGGIQFGASVAGFIRVLRLRKNGTEVRAVAQSAPVGGGADTVLTITAVIELAVNDYVEMVAYQDSGGALNSTSTSAAYGAAQQYAPVLEWVAAG